MSKPLIVAIEPDRGQADQLKAMVRARLRAELVHAETAEAALKALGNRIPDLVLTSAFLSPRDEAALAERLRTLDVAAAHVQTLTIPVLDAPKPAHAARGVLSSLLRDRAQSQAAPDGCDPAVFAEQCAAYLERATHERASQVIVHDEPIEERAIAPDPIEPSRELAAIAPPQHQSSAPASEAEFEPEPPPQPEPATAPVFELDLSSLLDANVVDELSAAIENVTASEPSPSRSRQKSRAAAAPLPRTRQAPAMKDDWGLFDPAQCGFADLLAKFDEVLQMAPPLPTDSASAGPLDVSR